MNTPPKITIEGLPATGKSSLAKAIQHALKAHGVQCAIVDSPERPGAIEASWFKRLRVLEGQAVVIETVGIKS